MVGFTISLESNNSNSLYFVNNIVVYIHTLQRASLIAGMEYGTEQWNGKWNGTVNIHSCS